MARKPMKTPGAPGAAMKSTTKRSPLGPNGKGGSGLLPVDDASAKDVYAGGLRPKKGVSDNDSALGVKGVRGRTQTNASAQFRITAKRSPLQEGPYPGTLAAGRILPSVMGSKQNFDQDASYYR